jgi:hypothetical protein
MAVAVAPDPPPQTEPSSLRTRVALALVTCALFWPMLTLPLIGDDFNVLYWARASVFQPHLLWIPWYGGLLGRLLPKLLLALGMSVIGPRHEAYEILNLLLHVANVLLLERLARGWTGSRRAAFLTALLFAVGFGFYGWAVMKISNLSMILSLTLTLWAFLEWERRRRGRALVLWLVALLAHEIIVFAPVVALLAPRGAAPVSARSRRRNTVLVLGGLTVAALLTLLPEPAGRAAVHFLELPSFTLFPVYLGPLLELRVLGLAVPAGFAHFLTSYRLEVGILLLLPAGFAIVHESRLRFAVAWLFLFWLPAATLMAQWGSASLQVRYLLVPAVGACLFAACLLDWLPSRLARSLSLATLVAWSVLVSGFAWLGAWQLVRAEPRWELLNREFWQELQDLERTHVPRLMSLAAPGIGHDPHRGGGTHSVPTLRDRGMRLRALRLAPRADDRRGTGTTRPTRHPGDRARPALHAAGFARGPTRPV